MYIPALILLDTNSFGFSTNLSIFPLFASYITTPYLEGSSTLVTCVKYSIMSTNNHFSRETFSNNSKLFVCNYRMLAFDNFREFQLKNYIVEKFGLLKTTNSDEKVNLSRTFMNCQKREDGRLIYSSNNFLLKDIYVRSAKYMHNICY